MRTRTSPPGTVELQRQVAVSTSYLEQVVQPLKTNTQLTSLRTKVWMEVTVTTGKRVDCYQTQLLESSLVSHRARNVDHLVVVGSHSEVSLRQRLATTLGSPVTVLQMLPVNRKRLTLGH